jgi:hypothetical protein
MLDADELTDDEVGALLEYAARGHEEMNAELRGFATTDGKQVGVHLDAVEQDAARLAAAIRGLKKLPVHQGEVFRGTSMRAEDLARYRVGAVIVQPSFVSASTSRAVAEHFRASNNGNVLMQVTSSNGRDISGISTYGNEREVLFNYAARFEVVSVSQVDTIVHIVAREV